ncbi:T9SS type A sorting domain-containing protein [Roseivirga sp.]|uniref:T9SS type A sorting domain-containing protein n=1 Tax=Roseivirga sp. TaxID=1964215 RepID=UPI003B52CBFD
MKSKLQYVTLGIILLQNVAMSQGAQLVSAVINGCGANDGNGEYVLVYSGGSSFNVSAANLDLRYGTTSPATTTFTDTYAALATANALAAALNALLPVSGCSDINFVGGSSGTSIPAGSHILIFNDVDITTIDFSAWCGTNLGDVYVLISTDTSWPTAGLFANAPTGSRFFTSIVNGNTTNMSYANLWASNADGNYVAWNDGGGSPFVYANYSSCNPSDTQSLPVTLISFKACLNDQQVHLEWVTSEEINNSHFEMERSANAINWQTIGAVEGHGNSTESNTYRFIDANPLYGRSFYRLIQHDFSGVTETFEVVSILYEKEVELKVFPNPADKEIEITCEEEVLQVQAFSNTGHSYTLMTNSEGRYNLDQLNPGIYYLKIKTSSRVIKETLIKGQNH